MRRSFQEFSELVLNKMKSSVILKKIPRTLCLEYWSMAAVDFMRFLTIKTNIKDYKERYQGIIK